MAMVKTAMSYLERDDEAEAHPQGRNALPFTIHKSSSSLPEYKQIDVPMRNQGPSNVVCPIYTIRTHSVAVSTPSE